MGAPYYCISDHIHYNEDDEYFPETLNLAKGLIAKSIDKPLFLASEITFADSEGNLPLHPRSKKYLSYTLIGAHYIPGTSINMEDTHQGKSTLYQWLEEDYEKLSQLFEIVESMYTKGIAKNSPDILVHPFSTILRCDFAHVELLSVFEKICEICQETRTAIEINRSEIRRFIEFPNPVSIEHPDVPPLRDFYHKLISIMAKYDILISLGSDAHNLNDVGDIGPCVDMINTYHISPDRILNLKKKGTICFSEVVDQQA